MILRGSMPNPIDQALLLFHSVGNYMGRSELRLLRSREKGVLAAIVGFAIAISQQRKDIRTLRLVETKRHPYGILRKLRRASFDVRRLLVGVDRRKATGGLEGGKT